MEPKENKYIGKVFTLMNYVSLSHIMQKEDPSKNFFIHEDDVVLTLTNLDCFYVKILVLSGKHKGKTGYECRDYFLSGLHYKEIEL